MTGAPAGMLGGRETARRAGLGGLPRVRRAAAMEWLVIGGSAAFYAAFIVRSGFSIAGRTYYTLIDDSMISMTYARNLADGHGLVWQPGPHVEGYTNFLWTLWMAVVHLFPLSDRMASLPVMISGAAILVATMLVVRSICRAVVPDRTLVPVAAMALVGLCFPLVFWTLRGMEVGLTALLVAVAARLALGLRDEVTGRRLIALGGVLAAAVLTRDEMVVPAAVMVAFAVAWSGRAQRRRVLAILGGILVLTVVAHGAFRLAYYGNALPNTYYLKLAGFPLSTRLHRGVVGLTYTVLTGLYLTVGLAVVALVSGRGTRRFQGLSLFALVFVTECVYSAYVGGDFQEELRFPNRFIATGLPLLMVLAAIGISDLVRRTGMTAARRAAVGLGIVLVLAGAFLQSHGWSETSILQFTGPIPYRTARVALALVAALVLGACLLPYRPRMARWMPVAAPLLLVLTLATLNYGPLRTWASSGPADKPSERLETTRGLIFRATSAPANSAALIAAGNWKYFSHRRGVDLLGKMDTVIAHGPSHDVFLKPGHTKWNYDYSIGKLRPDVVADLAFPTTSDLCHMTAWGYRQIAPRLFVRRAARGIDVPRLRARLLAFDHRPFIRMPTQCAGRA